MKKWFSDNSCVPETGMIKAEVINADGTYAAGIIDCSWLCTCRLWCAFWKGKHFVAYGTSDVPPS